MKNIINKIILAVLTAALVFSALPVTSVFAQGEQPPKGELTNEKMEEIWARQLKAHERLGKLFSDNERLVKLQELIDKAKANGKDVTALQTALDNFQAALKKAKPIYESMNGIVNSHQGFDTNGKVVDAEKAKATLKELRAKNQELKSALGGTGKALQEAVKAFRAANKPADKPERDS
jgi:DNA repair exonuclease SbcCD ATPase subunit